MLEATRGESRTLQGVGASSGITIGRAVVIHRRLLNYDRVRIAPTCVEQETRRFRSAVHTSISQLRGVRKRFNESGETDDHLHIIEAHELMLGDEMLVEGTCDLIADELVNAEWALENTLARVRGALQRIDDDILRERVSDVDFVGERIFRNLLGQGCEHVDDLAPDHIVVAHNLSPTETVQILQQNVLGLAIDVGSRTSHTAIVARSLEVPAVVGLHDVSELTAPGDLLILDGDEGVCIINPSASELERYRDRRSIATKRAKQILSNRELDAETTDGTRVRLLTNLDFVEEVDAMFGNGAEGVGLFRTEFLYLDRANLPDEEEQFAFYRSLLERVSPHPVTIRTLDMGGDKFASLHGIGDAAELGGLRAIRLCLRRPDIFRVQLRALLRASVHGRLRIMIPFVTSVSEVRRVREILDDCREELRREGQPFDENVELGLMIETPAAVLIADLLAKQVSFFSIGTNDLIQYTMASARDKEELSYLYHPLHPAILRMIRQTASAAREAGVRVSMCGEMASEPLYALVLLGLGLTELSMVASAVPAVKEIIRRSSTDETHALVEALWKMSTSDDVERHVLSYMHQRFPDIV